MEVRLDRLSEVSVNKPLSHTSNKSFVPQNVDAVLKGLACIRRRFLVVVFCSAGHRFPLRSRFLGLLCSTRCPGGLERRKGAGWYWISYRKFRHIEISKFDISIRNVRYIEVSNFNISYRKFRYIEI